MRGPNFSSARSYAITRVDSTSDGNPATGSETEPAGSGSEYCSTEIGSSSRASLLLETCFTYEIQRLEEARHARDELPPKTTAAIEDVLDRLREIDVARRYFKSLYLQVERSSLSRYLFSSDCWRPASQSPDCSRSRCQREYPFSQSARRLLFPLAVTVGPIPVSLLFAYILRTASVGPFRR